MLKVIRKMGLASVGVREQIDFYLLISNWALINRFFQLVNPPSLLPSKALEIFWLMGINN